MFSIHANETFDQNRLYDTHTHARVNDALEWWYCEIVTDTANRLEFDLFFTRNVCCKQSAGFSHSTVNYGIKLAKIATKIKQFE